LWHTEFILLMLGAIMAVSLHISHHADPIHLLL